MVLSKCRHFSNLKSQMLVKDIQKGKSRAIAGLAFFIVITRMHHEGHLPICSFLTLALRPKL